MTHAEGERVTSSSLAIGQTRNGYLISLYEDDTSRLSVDKLLIFAHCSSTPPLYCFSFLTLLNAFIIQSSKSLLINSFIIPLSLLTGYCCVSFLIPLFLFLPQVLPSLILPRSSSAPSYQLLSWQVHKFSVSGQLISSTVPPDRFLSFLFLLTSSNTLTCSYPPCTLISS
jgi:hypothetical protein